MVFNTAGGYWSCPEPGCNRRMYPKADLDRFGGPAVVGQGPFELMIYKDREAEFGRSTVIRATVNNVVMDLTDYVSYAKLVDGKIEVLMVFDRIIDPDGLVPGG
jgi:hypothetical protein